MSVLMFTAMSNGVATSSSQRGAFKYIPIFRSVSLLNDTQLAILVTHGNNQLTNAVVELVRFGNLPENICNAMYVYNAEYIYLMYKNSYLLCIT